MLKYQCKKCEATKELSRATLEVVHGKVRTREALCECGEYMREIAKDFDGFPCIKRTEPTLSNKNDKLWSRAKDTLK
tara:strand:- start:254 stop:484 length:231 start_codon:yes stop_codon:yes gene_type:complete